MSIVIITLISNNRDEKNGLEKLKKVKLKLTLFLKRKGGTLRSFGHAFCSPQRGGKKTPYRGGRIKRSILLAYRRNRIKRQIRAVIQKQKEKVLSSLSPGFYMVLYKGKLGVASESLSRDFEGLLKHFTGCD